MKSKRKASIGKISLLSVCSIFILLTLLLASSSEAATYNATGKWDVTTVGSFANTCTPDPNGTSLVSINQTGNTATLKDSSGIIYSGTVLGNVYTLKATYPDGLGTTNETITFTLTSATTATGMVRWTWTRLFFLTCKGGSTISKAVKRVPIAFGADVIADFGAGPGNGLKAFMNNSTWKPLYGKSPEIIAIGNIDGNTKDDVIVDFGAGPGRGLKVFLNNTTWKGLHGASPELIAVGDVDNNGSDDIIADFGVGAGAGLKIFMNNSTWKPIHGKSPELITVGDIDNNGRDDVVVDFGIGFGNGLQVFMNNTSWKGLYGKSPEIIVIGDIDN